MLSPPSSIGSRYGMTLLSAYEHNTLHNWMYSKNRDISWMIPKQETCNPGMSPNKPSCSYYGWPAYSRTHVVPDKNLVDLDASVIRRCLWKTDR